MSVRAEAAGPSDPINKQTVSTHGPGVGRTGVWLVGQVVANALIGFLFQRLLALRFGVSAEKSAFDIAFSVPFTIVSLSGLAMAHTVIVAFFTRIAWRDSMKRSEALSAILNASLLAIVVLVAVVFIAAEPLSRVIAPGFNVAERTLLKQLIAILVPLAIPLGIGMLLSAVSFACGLPMSQELLLLASRAVVIALAVVWPGRFDSVLVISVALVVAASGLVLLQVLLLRRGAGLHWVGTLRLAPDDRSWLLSRLLGFFAIAVVAQASAVYYRSIATLVSPGFVAAVGFAVSLIEPIGTAFGRVIVFYGARGSIDHGIESNHDDYSAHVRLLVRVAVVAASGAVVQLILLVTAEPIIALVYGGGRLNGAQLQVIADVAAIYGWTLPAVAASWALLSVSVARSKYSVAAVYVSGYLLQVAYLATFGPGVDGARLLVGYLIPVWWQALVLLSAVVIGRRRIIPLAIE